MPTAARRRNDLPTAADIAARLNSPDFRRAAEAAGYTPGVEVDVPQFAETLAERGYYLTQNLAWTVGRQSGHNLVCNRCGTYGATWTGPDERPGWGCLALCPPHKEELAAEHRRHAAALAGLRRVNFEQPSPRRAPGVRRLDDY